MDKKQNKDLHKACSKGEVPAIKKALAAGADVNLPDKKGNTPLHVAVSSGILDACKALLEAGADPRAKNAKGHTPSEYAEEKKKKNLVQVLREYEAGGGLQVVCKATVAVYTYEAGQWKQFDAAMVSLELIKCMHPFSYKLVGKSSKTIIDALLDVNFQYSKATEMFHNFQEGAKIWGFNFASEDEAKMILAQLDAAREEIRNPPPPPEIKETPKVAATTSAPPAPKAGNAPPPPPPPPSAPAAPAPPPSGGAPGAPPAPAGPAAPGAGPAAAAKPMSMADAIAAKAAGGGLKAAVERPAGGGGGGDLLSELTNRVKKRPVAEGGAGAGGAGAAAAAVAGGVPSAGQLQTFKEALIADFREELAASTNSIIEELVNEIRNLP